VSSDSYCFKRIGRKNMLHKWAGMHESTESDLKPDLGATMGNKGDSAVEKADGNLKKRAGPGCRRFGLHPGVPAGFEVTG
jgi:hypothetical protein